MPPFYPYTPTAVSPTMSPTSILSSFPLLTATPTLLISAEAGTSLSTPALIGIVVAVAFLFAGISWFAWYALVVLTRRKEIEVREKKRAERRAERAAKRMREAREQAGREGPVVWAAEHVVEEHGGER